MSGTGERRDKIVVLEYGDGRRAGENPHDPLEHCPASLAVV